MQKKKKRLIHKYYNKQRMSTFNYVLHVKCEIVKKEKKLFHEYYKKQKSTFNNREMGTLQLEVTVLYVMSSYMWFTIGFAY